jgi:hypothetical protein
MMRDGYKNKYTNPRRTDTTTDEYQVEIHSIKKSNCKNPKRLQEKTTTTKEVTSDPVGCEHCGLTFKANGIKRHQTVKHKNAQVNHYIYSITLIFVFIFIFSFSNIYILL